MLCTLTRILIFSAVLGMSHQSVRQRKGFYSPNYFSQYYCDCGLANEKSYSHRDYLRIIGGEKTRPHEFPWLALISYNQTTICGGSIISENFVLSAAHCFRTEFFQEKLKVAVAQYDMCNDNNDVVLLSVRRVIKHEKFDQKNFAFDIMLLQLSMKLTFNKFVRPICLPRPGTPEVQDFLADRNGLVSGWGTTNAFSTNLSCVPKKLVLPIFSRDDCNSTASTLFCAGLEEGGKDTCEGDSGGSFQLRNYFKRYEIIGIVSSGIGCAQPKNPGLYTDVTQFIPWILKHLTRNPYCYR